MTATPRQYDKFSTGEIIQCLRASNCSTQIEDEIKRRLDTHERAKAELKFIQKELREARGNVTGLWARTKTIDERIDALLTDMEG